MALLPLPLPAQRTHSGPHRRRFDPQRRAALLAFPMFGELSSGQLAELVAASDLRSVPAGITLVEQDSLTSHLHLLVRGTTKIVRTTKHSTGSTHVILDVAVGPVIVGGASLFDRQPQPAAVISLQATQLLLIERATVLRLLALQPDLHRALLAHLTGAIRAHLQRLDEVSSGSVEERVRHLLAALDRQHGVPVEGGRLIPLPLRRRDIACMVNAKTETVSRIFARLDREGLTRSTLDGIWLRSPSTEATGIHSLQRSDPRQRSAAG